MCTTCGCSSDENEIKFTKIGEKHSHSHSGHYLHNHDHEDHHHEHHHDHDHDYDDHDHHVGAAIGIIDEEEAKRTMEVLKQMGEEI